MKKLLSAVCLAGLLTAMTGCAYIKGGTDLSVAADSAGLTNVTTGDGTFENYTATGHYTGTEIGIAVGIPMLIKLIELYPMGQTNDALLADVGKAAKEDGANAMINVTPHTECYTGIPFFIVGLYIDKAEGTGIASK